MNRSSRPFDDYDDYDPLPPHGPARRIDFDFEDVPILCPCCRVVAIGREDGSWCAACSDAVDRHHTAAVRVERGDVESELDNDVNTGDDAPCRPSR
jgi:hypothetical protein